MSRAVIVSAVRTPFAKLGGGLAGHEATELGALVIKAALERIGLDANEPEYVIMGITDLDGNGTPDLVAGKRFTGGVTEYGEIQVAKGLGGGVLGAWTTLGDSVRLEAPDPVLVVDPQLVPGARAGDRKGDYGESVLGRELVHVVGAIAER